MRVLPVPVMRWAMRKTRESGIRVCPGACMSMCRSAVQPMRQPAIGLRSAMSTLEFRMQYTYEGQLERPHPPRPDLNLDGLALGHTMRRHIHLDTVPPALALQ